jgi:hypothetical protein
VGLNPLTAEVAVEDWHPVEDVIEWGFAQRPVVMADNADALVVSTDDALTEDGA